MSLNDGWVLVGFALHPNSHGGHGSWESLSSHWLRVSWALSFRVYMRAVLDHVSWKYSRWEKEKCCCIWAWTVDGSWDLFYTKKPWGHGSWESLSSHWLRVSWALSFGVYMRAVLDHVSWKYSRWEKEKFACQYSRWGKEKCCCIWAWMVDGSWDMFYTKSHEAMALENSWILIGWECHKPPCFRFIWGWFWTTYHSIFSKWKTYMEILPVRERKMLLHMSLNGGWVLGLVLHKKPWGHGYWESLSSHWFWVS